MLLAFRLPLLVSSSGDDKTMSNVQTYFGSGEQSERRAISTKIIFPVCRASGPALRASININLGKDHCSRLPAAQAMAVPQLRPVLRCWRPTRPTLCEAGIGRHRRPTTDEVCDRQDWWRTRPCAGPGGHGRGRPHTLQCLDSPDCREHGSRPHWTADLETPLHPGRRRCRPAIEEAAVCTFFLCP